MHSAAFFRIALCYVLAFAGHPLLAQDSHPDSLFARANRLRTKGDFAQAILAYGQCLDWATTHKDSLRMGNSLIGIGIVHDEGGKPDTALHYYFAALAIYKKIGNATKTGGTLKNIGNVYRLLKYYDKAYTFLQQALAIQYEQHDSARIGNVLNDIGLFYMDQDSSAKARQFFEQVVTVYGRHVNQETKAFAFNNLGIVTVREKQYTQALRYYQAGLDGMQQLQKTNGIALLLNNIGDVYDSIGDHKRALAYYLRSYDTVKRIQANELLMGLYNDLARVYSRTGRYQQAFEYVTLGRQLQDTLYQEASRKAFSEMEARYQNEKKQAEISLLQRANTVANREVAVQRRAKYLWLIASALILGAAGLLYKSYTARQKANRALNVLNTRLTEANSSKAKLISIISHDLRSPVSSLFHFLQLKKARPQKLDKQAQEAFDQKISASAEQLLEAMEDLLLWSKTQMEQFEPVMETVHVAAVLEEIIQLHEPFAASKNITLGQEVTERLSLYTDPNFLRIILRNLTSNAIKFTPPHGAVVLSAVQQAPLILLTVRDNGPGISEADARNIFEWNSIRSDSSGLGLKLAREFTEKLGGKLSVSASGEGTTFTISLPAGQPRTGTAL